MLFQFCDLLTHCCYNNLQVLNRTVTETESSGSRSFCEVVEQVYKQEQAGLSSGDESSVSEASIPTSVWVPPDLSEDYFLDI